MAARSAMTSGWVLSQRTNSTAPGVSVHSAPNRSMCLFAQSGQAKFEPCQIAIGIGSGVPQIISAM